MKKLALSFLLLALPQLTFANAEALKAVIDNYNYSMTVEWDQTDKEFAQQKLEELKASLKELNLEQIKRDDLKQVFPTIREDVFKDQLDFLKGMKSSELESFLIQNQTHLYQQGSSWNGEIIYPIMFVGFVVTVVAINLYREGKYEDCVTKYNDHNFCENKY